MSKETGRKKLLKLLSLKSSSLSLSPASTSRNLTWKILRGTFHLYHQKITKFMLLIAHDIWLKAPKIIIISNGWDSLQVIYGTFIEMLILLGVLTNGIKIKNSTSVTYLVAKLSACLTGKKMCDGILKKRIITASNFYTERSCY